MRGNRRREGFNCDERIDPATEQVLVSGIRHGEHDGVVTGYISRKANPGTPAIVEIERSLVDEMNRPALPKSALMQAVLRSDADDVRAAATSGADLAEYDTTADGV